MCLNKWCFNFINICVFYKVIWVCIAVIIFVVRTRLYVVTCTFLCWQRRTSAKLQSSAKFYKWWFSMAQDVCSKMAEDPWQLVEDGYLNADTDLKKIVYHPSLNVILIRTACGIVRVLDVNSGVVLQSSFLSGTRDF